LTDFRRYNEVALASGAGSSAPSGKHLWQLSPSDRGKMLLIS